MLFPSVLVRAAGARGHLKGRKWYATPQQAPLANSGALPHTDTTPLLGCVGAGTEASVHAPESLLCACPPAQQGCAILALSDRKDGPALLALGVEIM